VDWKFPNLIAEKVGLQELLGRPDFTDHKSPLAFVGSVKRFSGEPCIVDLAAMPHLLIVGHRGRKKCFVFNALILLYFVSNAARRVKFVLIDPKRLELPSYTEIPHLYDPGPCSYRSPVINSKQAAKALSRS